jgi:MFS family permease
MGLPIDKRCTCGEEYIQRLGMLPPKKRQKRIPQCNLAILKNAIELTVIQKLAHRLPFYYGWVIIAVAFVTMAMGVNSRTAFSLLLPPILGEFGWDRSVTAGAFSFGFLISAFGSPVLGRLMDVKGPKLIAQIGVASIVAGLYLATKASHAWHLYLTLGVLIGVGSVCLGYSGQSLYLPNWFVQRRGLAMGIAFSGVGVGSIVLLPWMQTLIDTSGWRHACLMLAGVVFIVGLPMTFLLAKKPQDLGLLPDGVLQPLAGSTDRKVPPKTNVIDKQWVATEWTLALALRTKRFWWLAVANFCTMYAWYAVQVHQTKYLVEVGFSAADAAWALGAVSLAGIPGQIALGHLSDRIGREIVWTISNIGFVGTYLALLALATGTNTPMLYFMILMQGVLGYGVTAVFGAIPAEIFEGKNYGSIFGFLMVIAISGGAFGPWLTGLLFDQLGNYVVAYWVAITCCVFSCIAMWYAPPGKVRAVSGRI